MFSTAATPGVPQPRLSSKSSLTARAGRTWTGPEDDRPVRLAHVQVEVGDVVPPKGRRAPCPSPAPCLHRNSPGRSRRRAGQGPRGDRRVGVVAVDGHRIAVHVLVDRRRSRNRGWGGDGDSPPRRHVLDRLSRPGIEPLRRQHPVDRVAAIPRKKDRKGIPPLHVGLRPLDRHPPDESLRCSLTRCSICGEILPDTTTLVPAMPEEGVMLMLPARTTSPPNVGGLAHTTTIDASSQVTIMRTVVLEPPPMKAPCLTAPGPGPAPSACRSPTRPLAPAGGRSHKYPSLGTRRPTIEVDWPLRSHHAP